jgi:hypothetical protein
MVRARVRRAGLCENQNDIPIMEAGMMSARLP